MLRLIASTLPIAIAAPVKACQLALSLALDVSASVDSKEFLFQANGLANALLSERVSSAILAIPELPVALHVYQWSGRRNQLTVLDWTMLETQSDIVQAAETLRTMRRSARDFPTSLGYGLGYGAVALSKAPNCLRKTLDVSGDGQNNHGFGPAEAYRHFRFDGVTVNGLAIGGHDPQIVEYYLTEVIHGPGAFVEIARDYSDFERAMTRKLEREIGTMSLSRMR